MKLLLGKKLGMSQMFNEKGNIVPVTLIEAGPCFITQIKTEEKDKYKAVQIGYENKKKAKKTEKGKEFKYLREYKEDGEVKVGDKVDLSVLKVGDKVAVSAISKGKGFSGVIQRWGFHSKPATHGAKHEERALGSVGRRFPQRVTKGRKMSGRLGYERTTVKNLLVSKIDVENNVLAVKGAVPGPKGKLVEIRLI